jgi:phage-related protein
MTQISALTDELEIALASIKARLDTPAVPETSETEERLERDLEQAHSNLSKAHEALEEQKNSYTTLTQELGDLKMRMDQMQADTSAEDAKAEAEHAKTEAERQLSAIRAENEKAISQLATENTTLKIQISEMEKAAASVQAADMQVGFKSSQSASASSNSDLDAVKQLHSNDIAEVQNILKQLKPLVEE